MAAVTPTARSRAGIALAGSLALHGILLACLDFRPMPHEAFDAGKPASSLAVAFLRPMPSSAQPATARRSATGAAPVAPLSAEAQPPDPLETNQTAPPPTTGAPQFDLDALRQQARDLERRGRKAPPVAPQNLGQTLPTPILESDTPLTRPIAKALRPDCKTAYAPAGLFAIPALLYDTVRDKGCQW
ncbi:MAG: hypothetical protein WCV99_04090 [Sterolibacterium sp.]